MEDKHAWVKISQDIALKNEKGEVLVLRQPKSGKWILVGGHLNEGEDWFEGLKREVREEIGTDDFKLTGIIGINNWVVNGEPKYGAFFTGSISSDIEIVLSSEHSEYAWIKNKEDVGRFIFAHPNLRKIVFSLFPD